MKTPSINEQVLCTLSIVKKGGVSCLPGRCSAAERGRRRRRQRWRRRRRSTCRYQLPPPYRERPNDEAFSEVFRRGMCDCLSNRLFPRSRMILFCCQKQILSSSVETCFIFYCTFLWIHLMPRLAADLYSSVGIDFVLSKSGRAPQADSQTVKQFDINILLFGN